MVKTGLKEETRNKMLVTRGALYILGRKAIGVVPILSFTIAGVGVYLMTGLIVAEIIMRSVFTSSIPFAIEYSSYLTPAIGVGGAAYTLSREGHVRVDLILHRLPGRLRQWLLLFGYVGGLVFSIILSIGAIDMALDCIKTGALSLYPTKTPLGYPQLILCIGFVLLSVQLIIEIRRKVKLL